MATWVLQFEKKRENKLWGSCSAARMCKFQLNVVLYDVVAKGHASLWKQWCWMLHDRKRTEYSEATDGCAKHKRRQPWKFQMEGKIFFFIFSWEQPHEYLSTSSYSMQVLWKLDVSFVFKKKNGIRQQNWKITRRLQFVFFSYVQISLQNCQSTYF